MATQVRKVYIAGPMTGLPQFNIPAFVSATERLRAAGFEVVSPVERDSDAVREAALASPDGKLTNDSIAGETWGQILARDVAIVADEVDGVVVLPGWNRSRGARLEVTTALLCNKPIFVEHPQLADACLMPVPHSSVVSALMHSFLP